MPNPPTQKIAELLGLNPEELKATTEKLRAQARQARETLKDELHKHSEALGAKLDTQLKEGVSKAEQLALELEEKLDVMGKEAARLADQASDELKKVYEQAKQRIHKKPQGPG